MYIALYVLYIVYQSIVKYILFLHRPLLFIHLLACHSSQYTFITGCLSATTKIQISQLWDFIETWGFREDLKSKILSPPTPPQKAHCATKIEISQLWDFIRDLGFSRGPQAQSSFTSPPPPWPPPESTLCNNKNWNFSALGLDRDPRWSQVVSHINKNSFFQLWSLIETWGFREDLMPIVFSPLTSPLTPPNPLQTSWTPSRKHTVQKQKFKFLIFGTW